MTHEAMQLKPVGKNKYVVDRSPESPADDDDYDPHLHRDLPHGTSNTETLVHLLKGALGTGILAMPEAFKNAGIFNGLISTILIGMLCTYCLHVLVKAQYILCKRMRVPVLTYPESMRLALEMGPECLRGLARFSPLLVDAFLITYQFGICCVYMVFVGVNLKSVVDESTGENIHVAIYMLATLIPFILINSIRNLKLLAPFSVVANIITFISFGVVAYYMFRGMPEISRLSYWGTAFTYPLFFGTTLFALEAVGVVIAVENNMKTPKSFGGSFGVLNISMVVIVALYVAMGFFGYWRYGENSQASVTLNLPKEDILTKVVNLLYSVAIYISYGLQGYVPVKILWDTYIEKQLIGSKHLLAWEYVLRVVSVIFTFILAATIPLLGLFISLVGAFCLSALGLAFPALMEICVMWPDDLGPCKWVLIRNVLLILFGIIGLVAGSYSSLAEIVAKLTSGEY